jgi:hypothetical protein
MTDIGRPIDYRFRVESWRVNAQFGRYWWNDEFSLYDEKAIFALGKFQEENHGDYTIAGIVEIAILSQEELEELKSEVESVGDRPLSARDMPSIGGIRIDERRIEASVAIPNDHMFLLTQMLSMSDRKVVLIIKTNVSPLHSRSISVVSYEFE